MRILALAVTAAFLAITSLAIADEVTRETYKDAVEPICAVNAKANERILKGVRADVKKGKLSPAGTRLIKAAKALKRTYSELKAVPQPSADTARLAKWLSYVKTEASLFEKTGKALKAGNKHLAQRLEIQLTHNANKANNQVLSFNFKSCHFEPSKYT